MRTNKNKLMTAFPWIYMAIFLLIRKFEMLNSLNGKLIDSFCDLTANQLTFGKVSRFSRVSHFGLTLLICEKAYYQSKRISKDQVFLQQNCIFLKICFLKINLVGFVLIPIYGGFDRWEWLDFETNPFF